MLLVKHLHMYANAITYTNNNRRFLFSKCFNPYSEFISVKSLLTTNFIFWRVIAKDRNFARNIPDLFRFLLISRFCLART